MYISQKLRAENIAEYLLYMWQIEDLIRAYGLSLTRIKREYVSQFSYNDEQKDGLLDWFGNLIRMMREEACQEKGHLQINKNIVNLLAELNARLLESTKFPFYRAEYYKVLPFIVELRQKSGKENSDECEIETCFNALYGKIMLSLGKKEISTETQHALKEITTFIAMLTDYYHKDKANPLKFD